jgi:hypothetical protein
MRTGFGAGTVGLGRTGSGCACDRWMPRVLAVAADAVFAAAPVFGVVFAVVFVLVVVDVVARRAWSSARGSASRAVVGVRGRPDIVAAACVPP